jgi:hypothetical protein
MIHTNINVYYDLDRQSSAPLSLDNPKIQQEIDKLFKPFDKSILQFLPKTSDLSAETIKTLIQNEPTIKD